MTKQLTSALCGLMLLTGCAVHRLGVLAGQQPQAVVPTLEQPARLPSLPKLVTLGRSQDLLRRRPDIRAAERNLAAATARIGIVTADLFPRVTSIGSIALEANTFRTRWLSKR